MIHRILSVLILCLCLFSKPVQAAEGPNFCAAIQGNGDAIFGHFHSLAHLISEYGMVNAVAGSSSATLTMFLLESMMLNPAVNDPKVGEVERRHRISLMLKSLVGFFELNEGRKETVALYSFLMLLKQLKERGFVNPNANPADAHLDGGDFHELRRLFGELYNLKFTELFINSPNRKFHLDDFRNSIQHGLFRVDTDRVLLRPFPLQFRGLATATGWIANFYAGRRYDNKEHWNDWFEACGKLEELKDKTWGQIAYYNYVPSKLEDFFGKEKVRVPTPCQKKFAVLIGDYDRHDKNSHPATDRVEEQIGAHLPAIPITGLIVGGGVKRLHDAKLAYRRAKPIPVVIDYDTEFKVGYFGPKNLLEAAKTKIAENEKKRPSDLKTSKFLPLLGYTWRQALETSPAEPSLSEAVEMNGKMTSIGGWADPFPATILKLAGCTNVAFVAAERDDFKLIVDLNHLLGAKDSKYVDDGLARGLEDSDAVWCTQWNKYAELSMEKVYEMTESTFHAGLESQADFFTHRGNLAKPPTRKRFGCN